jgi:CheY-like chemotaxis protein
MTDSSVRKFGDLLVHGGVLSEEVLSSLFEEGLASSENRIASRILARGLLTESQLVAVLAHQHGHPGVVLEESVLDATGPKLIPRSVAERHHLLPLSVTEDTITLATTDIYDREIFDQIRFSSGRDVNVLVALEGRVREALPPLYEAFAAGAATFSFNQTADETASEVKLEILRPQLPEVQEAQLESNPILTLEEIGSEDKPTDVTQKSASKDLVLVVEDDAAIRRLLVQVLTHQSCNVIEASTGSEALKKLRQDHPSLVVLDAMLPEIHGFEICSQMKKSPVLRSIPVIMVSAIYKGWEHARNIQEVHRADAFIEKPFELSYLRAAVAKFLGQESPLSSRIGNRFHEASAHRENALRLHKAGQMGDANAEIKRWVELDPFDSEPYLLQGNIAFAEGRFDQALKFFERATTFDSTSFTGWKNLALVHEKLGFSQKSLESWKQAMEWAPSSRVRNDIKEHLNALDEALLEMWVK